VLNKPGKKFVILGKTRWQSDRHKKWMQHLGKVTEAQALEEWGKEALGTAAHITTTSTLAIMNVGYDEEQKSRVQIASLLLLEDANLFAAVLNARRRKPISPEPALKIKVGRKIYERPVYTSSTWWPMLLKGDCKIEGILRTNFSGGVSASHFRCSDL
jgi:hypothetical protein